MNIRSIYYVLIFTVYASSVSYGLHNPLCNNITDKESVQHLVRPITGYPVYIPCRGDTIVRYLRYGNHTEVIALNRTILPQYADRMSADSRLLTIHRFISGTDEGIYTCSNDGDDTNTCVHVMGLDFYKHYFFTININAGEPLRIKCQNINDTEYHAESNGTWAFINRGFRLEPMCRVAWDTSLYMECVQLFNDGFYICENTLRDFYMFRVNVVHPVYSRRRQKIYGFHKSLT